MPTVPEIIKLINEIDVTKSSCVKDINTRFCKEAIIIMYTPSNMLSLFDITVYWMYTPILCCTKGWKSNYAGILETFHPDICIC